MTPCVLIHVQHLLGIGHLQRAAAIAGALRERGARVVLATGGAAVPQVEAALERRGVEIVRLAVARSADSSFSALVDENGKVVDDAWKARRRDAVLALFAATKPDILITEMYPFGRRPFRFELMPLLEAARARPQRPLIAGSVRDILVTKQKPGRAEEMAETARRFYDLVLVHSDPKLIPFEASFPCAGEIQDLIRYTGYVTEAKPPATGADRRAGEILISAGGGAVGWPLLQAAVGARALSAQRDRPWRLITGGNLPQADFDQLRAMAGGFTVERFRTDFKELLARCRVSVSQGGYNTVLEILASRTPAVIVPFAEGAESEQTDRARLLAAKNLLRLLPAPELEARRLAREIDHAAVMQIPSFTINLDGARQSAAIILDALAKRTA
ncbi:glycosyltransferase family protein [Dongia sedimenti]|uniref:Glycosyltransferase n=1 Tax=Dongia sedimenti TaxID=3064282 RepID=A0ABU0YN57_9PROT|nr:glycosyltransferase [Rhodospirillaceae bacterium R-7]